VLGRSIFSDSLWDEGRIEPVLGRTLDYAFAFR
jgi:hypothetical protein